MQAVSRTERLAGENVVSQPFGIHPAGKFTRPAQPDEYGLETPRLFNREGIIHRLSLGTALGKGGNHDKDLGLSSAHGSIQEKPIYTVPRKPPSRIYERLALRKASSTQAVAGPLLPG